MFCTFYVYYVNVLLSKSNHSHRNVAYVATKVAQGPELARLGYRSKLNDAVKVSIPSLFSCV